MNSVKIATTYCLYSPSYYCNILHVPMVWIGSADPGVMTHPIKFKYGHITSNLYFVSI